MGRAILRGAQRWIARFIIWGRSGSYGASRITRSSGAGS